MIKIPQIKYSEQKFVQDIKPDNIPSIQNNIPVLRFFSYNKKCCGIENLSGSQGKKIINKIKDITSIALDDPKYPQSIDIVFTKNGEYERHFKDFEKTGTMCEFKCGGNSRIFGFYLFIGEDVRPVFNVVLITSSKHLETGKNFK